MKMRCLDFGIMELHQPKRDLMKVLQTTDSHLIQYNGMEILDIFPMNPDDYDKEEVGPMFHITLANGMKCQAFEDEIADPNELEYILLPGNNTPTRKEDSLTAQ